MGHSPIWLPWYRPVARRNCTLGVEIEGAFDDVGGVQFGHRMPRPMLVFGTAETLIRRPIDAVDFVEDALQLRKADGWTMQKRNAAYLDLVHWFFSGWDGPAWISTIPFKPQGNPTLPTQTGIPINAPTDIQLLGNSGNVALGHGLPELPLRSFQFFHDLDVETQFYRTGRLQRHGGIDYGVALGSPGEDRKWFDKGAIVAVMRKFYAPNLRLYTCPHVTFVKADVQSSECWIERLCVTLHPEDGRTIGIKVGRQTFDRFLTEQPVDLAMLREIGAIRGREESGDRNFRIT